MANRRALLRTLRRLHVWEVRLRFWLWLLGLLRTPPVPADETESGVWADRRAFRRGLVRFWFLNWRHTQKNRIFICKFRVKNRYRRLKNWLEKRGR